MPFHDLHDWDSTRNALHQAAQVLNAIKIPSVMRQPNALHHSLIPDAAALRTGRLGFGGEMRLDLLAPGGAALTYASDAGGFSVLLAGQTQQSLLATVLAELARIGLTVTAHDADITGTTPLLPEAGQVGSFAVTLDNIYGQLARFRGHLAGMMTPIVLWPHHFDLAFLYFLSGSDAHQHPHMNFGFAPHSPGFPRPYFYAYRHPMPEGLYGLPLPEAARWHNQGWTGVVIDYDAFLQAYDHERRLAYWLYDIFEVLSSR